MIDISSKTYWKDKPFSGWLERIKIVDQVPNKWMNSGKNGFQLFAKSMLLFSYKIDFLEQYFIPLTQSRFKNQTLLKPLAQLFQYILHSFLERILRVPSLILLKPATADQGWLIWNNKKETKLEILGTLHKVKTCQKEAFYDLSKWIGPNPVGIFPSSFKNESWLCSENLA